MLEECAAHVMVIVGPAMDASAHFVLHNNKLYREILLGAQSYRLLIGFTPSAHAFIVVLSWARAIITTLAAIVTGDVAQQLGVNANLAMI